MMKKLLCILLVTALLLCGCTGETEPAGSTPASTAGTAGSIDYMQNVIDNTAVAPAYTGQPLVEYGPNREVYIGLSNRDLDLYPDYSYQGDSFFILTKEHYDISEIQVSVPSRTEYEVQIIDMTEFCQMPSHSTVGKQFGLQDYQYMSQQGVSWQEITQKQLYANTASILALSAANMEDKQSYQAIASEYEAVMKAYETQYQAITQADMLQFSAYDVYINFTNLGSHAETIETVDFTIGGKTYTQEIGQWRLHQEILPEVDLTIFPEGMGYYYGGTVSTSSSPFTGGIIRDSGFHFEAKEDLTVTGIQVRRAGMEVLGGRVNILKGNKNAASDYYWDGQQPLEFEAGTEVEIAVYLRNPCFEEYEVNVSGCLVLNYTVGGKEHLATRPCTWGRANSRVWDTYLMAFEGIDMGEYYTCYYRPLWESWIDELPEAWRE